MTDKTPQTLESYAKGINLNQCTPTEIVELISEYLEVVYKGEEENKYPRMKTCDDCGADMGLETGEKEFEYEGNKVTMVYGDTYIHDCPGTKKELKRN